MEVNVAVVTLRERHKQSLIERIILHIVAMATDYADHEQVVRRTVFRSQGVTNVLTDCFHIRKNFLCHRVVNDRDAGRIFVFSFGLGEVAPAQKLYTDYVEVTWCRRIEDRTPSWHARLQ